MSLVTPSSSTGWAGESIAMAISSSVIIVVKGVRHMGQDESANQRQNITTNPARWIGDGGLERREPAS